VIAETATVAQTICSTGCRSMSKVSRNFEVMM
jgi:hypothetical protein